MSAPIRVHAPHLSVIGEEYLALEKRLASQARLVPYIQPEEPIWPAEEARPQPNPRERIVAGKAIGCIVMPTSPYAPLSLRQEQLLRDRSYGRDRNEISSERDITPGVVNVHLAKVRKKLGATTTAQALHHAMLYSPPYPDAQPTDVSPEALQTLRQLACDPVARTAPPSEALEALAVPLGVAPETSQHLRIVRRAHEAALFFPVFMHPLHS